MSVRPVAVFTLLAVLIVCDQARGQEYYGVKIDSDNVVFLLDTSGSMENKDEGIAASQPLNRTLDEAGRKLGERLGRLGGVVSRRLQSETTKLGSARRELIKALNSLDGETNFTIIGFGVGVQEWPGGFRVAGSMARRLAQAYTSQLSAGGGTPMSSALTAAFAVQDVETVFLVSDGRPTDAAGTAILAQLPALDRGRNIVVNTVGIGPDQDADLLCQIARHTGGFYVKDGEIVCHGGICEDPETRAFFNPHPDNNYHQYNEETTVCLTTQRGCTPELVFRTMISQVRLVAPTDEKAPVADCGSAILPPQNPIRMTVDESAMSVANYTKVGHVFHPGRVVRTIAKVGNRVVVRTFGQGNGDWSLANQYVFNETWPHLVDPRLVEEVKKAIQGSAR